MFQDPSVQRAVAESQQPNLDDYQPFANQQNSTSGGQGAVLQTQNIQQPPAYTASNQQQISSQDFEELKRRQEELEKRAQELERREAELRNNPHNGKNIFFYLLEYIFDVEFFCSASK